MVIRKAVRDDLPGLLELYSFLFEKEDYSNLSEFSDKWEEILNFNGLIYFVAEHDGKIAASCNIAIIPNLSRNRRSYALIENVITHPDFRRMGLGKAVIEGAVNEAVSCNCYKVMLLSTASKNREAAHYFYSAVGFDGDSKRGFSLYLN